MKSKILRSVLLLFLTLFISSTTTPIFVTAQHRPIFTVDTLQRKYFYSAPAPLQLPEQDTALQISQLEKLQIVFQKEDKSDLENGIITIFSVILGSFLTLHITKRERRRHLKRELKLWKTLIYGLEWAVDQQKSSINSVWHQLEDFDIVLPRVTIMPELAVTHFSALSAISLAELFHKYFPEDRATGYYRYLVEFNSRMTVRYSSMEKRMNEFFKIISTEFSALNQKMVTLKFAFQKFVAVHKDTEELLILSTIESLKDIFKYTEAPNGIHVSVIKNNLLPQLFERFEIVSYDPRLQELITQALDCKCIVENIEYEKTDFRGDCQSIESEFESAKSNLENAKNALRDLEEAINERKFLTGAWFKKIYRQHFSWLQPPLKVDAQPISEFETTYEDFHYQQSSIDPITESKN